MAQLGVLEVKVTPDLEGFGSQVNSAMSSIGRGLVSGVATVSRDMANIGRSVATMGVLGGGALAAIGFKTAASLETAELQFKVLLGSADEAKAHVKDLFQFAKDTPFEAEEVIKASRIMQVMGGDALNTKENLTLVGDAAAAVGGSFEEVGFWTARAYALMQSGQPWGEAGLRLQELGVISGDTRLEIDKMAEAGASGNEQWKVFAEDVGEYAGAMEDLQNTWVGVTSTLKDTVKVGMATLMQPAFESVKEFMFALRDLTEMQAFEALLKGIGTLLTPLTNLLDDGAAALAEWGKSLTVSGVLDGLEQFAGFLDNVSGQAMVFADALEPIAPILLGIGGAFLSTYLSGIPLIGMLLPGKISPITGALIGLLASSEDVRDAFKGLGDAVLGAANEALPAMKGSLDTIVSALGEGLAGAIEGLTPGLEWLVRTALPAIGEMGAQLAGPLADLATNLGELGSTLIESLGPGLLAIADGVTDVLSAGIGALSDLIGLLADNSALAVVAVGGLAGAFVGFKVAKFLNNLDLTKGAIGGVLQTIERFKLQMSLAPPDMPFLSKVKGSAMEAGGAISGIGSAMAGIGIGLAVTAGVALLTEHFQKQAEEAAKDREQIAGLADAYAEAGVSANTFGNYLRDQVRLMQESGDPEGETISKLAELAGGYDNLSSSLEGNAAQRREVRDAIREYARDQAGLTKAEAEKAEAQDKANEGTMNEYYAYGNLSKASNEYLDIIGPLISEMGELKGESEEAKEVMTDTAKAEEEAARVTDTYTTAIDNLRFSMERLEGGAQSVADADRRVAEAQNATTKAFEENGKVLEGNTEGALANQSALEAQRDSIYDAMDAMAASGATSEETAAKGHNLSLVMIDQVARSMGISSAAAAQLLTDMNLLPEDVDTYANLHTLEAEQKLVQWLTDLGLTPDQIRTLADLNKNGAEADWRSYVGKLNLTPAEEETLMQLLTAGAFTDMAHFEEALNNVQDEDVNVNIRATWLNFAVPAAVRGMVDVPVPGGLSVRGTPMLASAADYGPGIDAMAASTDLGTVTLAPKSRMAGAAVRIENAQFNEPADFDALLNRVNLALAAGRL